MSLGINLTGTGPVIIFLHGSLSSGAQWKRLIQHLSSDFTCVNVDLQGYGAMAQVAIDAPYCFKSEIDRICDALDQAALSGPYFIVGHSFGAALALRLADELQQQVKALCLYEPVAFHLLATDHVSRVQVSAMASEMQAVPAVTAAAMFTNYWNGEHYFSALPKAMQVGLANMMEKVAMDFDAIINEPKTVQDYASSLTAKILLMTGVESPQTAQDVASQISAHLPEVTRVEIKGGHMAPVLTPELVEPVIAQFLRDNS